MTQPHAPLPLSARLTRTAIAALLLLCCLAQLLPAQSRTRYWPTAGTTSVRIDGYSFDFDRRGGIDGPFSHNGSYRLVKNQAGLLEMRLHFGTDRRQVNDMNVSLVIKNGVATVRGRVKGKDIGAVQTPVQRRGKYLVLEFQVRSKTGAGRVQTHAIRWVAP